MYDLKSVHPETRNVVLVVRHHTPGKAGTCVETEVAVHLTPEAVNPIHRVSAVGIDVRFVSAASLPEFAEEMARVLERVAAGLREGPAGALKAMYPGIQKGEGEAK